MRDLYSDDYESVAGGGGDRLIPDGVRKLSGAAVFLALVAALGLWSFRLGTRDASEVPIIKAMAGPARVEPANPGGVQAAHQGLEVNSVLAGRPAPMPRDAAGRPAGAGAAAGRGRAQGELVLAAPAILAGQVLGEDGDLPMPPQEDTALAPGLPLGDAAAAAAGPRPRNRPANLVAARPKPAAAAPKPAAAKVVEAKAEAPKPAPTKVASAAPAARGRGRASGGAAGAARRLRQRGDHPAGLVAAGGASTRTCCRRRTSSSSGPPPMPGSSTGCGWRGSPAPRRRGRCARRCARGASPASR